MAIEDEVIVTGKANRFWDNVNSVWKRFSCWTKGSDVECDDGQTVESKIGNLKGITNSTSVSEENFALDARQANPNVAGSIANNTNTLINQMAYTGCKNLFENPMTTTTSNGITLTKNADGSITCSGTANNEVGVRIAPFITGIPPIGGFIGMDVKKGKYILSGCPEQVNKTYESCDCCMKLVVVRTASLQDYSEDIYYEFGDGVEFEVENDVTKIAIWINIKNGVTINSIFYPMLRFSNITDSTYVPYAPTNSELNSNLANINSSLENVGTSVNQITNNHGYGTMNGGYTKIGKTVTVCTNVILNNDIPANTYLCSGLPTSQDNGITPLRVYNNNKVVFSDAIINYTGEIRVAASHTKGDHIFISGAYISNL